MQVTVTLSFTSQTGLSGLKTSSCVLLKGGHPIAAKRIMKYSIYNPYITYQILDCHVSVISLIVAYCNVQNKGIYIQISYLQCNTYSVLHGMNPFKDSMSTIYTVNCRHVNTAHVKSRKDTRKSRKSQLTDFKNPYTVDDRISLNKIMQYLRIYSCLSILK